MLLTASKIAMMTMGTNPFGLAVAALEALHLYASLRSEAGAWDRYDEVVEAAELRSRGPGLCIEAGDRLPFAATIVEGTGTALGADGLPVPAVPGGEISGGGLLQGGPFRVIPHPPEPCTVVPRPAPVALSWPEHYLRVIVPVSLIYLGATALWTRSPSRTAAALLLVNARPAMLGTAAAVADTAARVLRDGAACRIRTDELVPGDLLLIANGDRSPADARVIEAHDLDVDEAALTGESFPVFKRAQGGTPSNRILLEGSDVLMGRGRAVVVAVGRETRMGATTAAVLSRIKREDVLTKSLARLFWRVLPLMVLSGAIVTVGGVLRGRPPLGELLSGTSIALAAVPEALPVLAGLGQAAAARRLAARNVLLRRPAAIEALGRVDVVCVDKTGTLTEGRLSVRRVARCAGAETVVPGDRSPQTEQILRAAGLASPHPEAEGHVWHATDQAVLQAAQDAGLAAEIRRERREESRFASDQPYHAALVDERLYLKGSPEWVVERCTQEWVDGQTRALNPKRRARLMHQVRDLAARGLRVLMVARGETAGSVRNPQGLVALGLIGIADPLRETVPAAVRRCQAAGIRMIMLIGDHPVTAEHIAREAGLLDGADAQDRVMADVVGLDDGELDARLERTVVIARTTPLDKLRIVESLRRQGHAIAMTGDGVIDAPALRLADVGVALGRSATAVARHTAEVVLEDNDFQNLAEALVEGRSFWRNLRRGLALLLGGNLGELGYMAVGSAFGRGAPLTVRQILAINLITDALPTFALTVQGPEHRVLAGLERGGPAAFGAPLHDAMVRRALATAGPALGAYLLARTDGSIEQARSVGFATLVSTQLALTVTSGRGPGGELAGPVAGAVAASGGAMLGLLTIAPLRSLLAMGAPTPLGWALIGGSALLAPHLARIPWRRAGLWPSGAKS